MESSIPQENYVGLLQEKCNINKINKPEYSISEVGFDNKFKCTCLFQGWTTEGTGFSKRYAKQIAAQEMLNKIENESLFSNIENKGTNKESAISKLNIFCQKEKKEIPLFSEMKEEDDQFVYSCTFDNFKGIGKGNNKKIAKENSAEAVVKHFNIETYIENIRKSDERQKFCKNPSQQLHELCQLKKLKIEYVEERVQLSGKKEAYVIICKVGDLQEKSAPNSSKKLAKIEAASLLLNLLSNITPDSSPLVPTDEKRKLSEYKEEETTDDEPLLKQMKSE